MAFPNNLQAQELEKVEAFSTFGAARVSLTQSVETTSEGVLTFDVQHQFGSVRTGIDEFFGLDQATTRLGLSYGITDWLSVGIGRSGLYKAYDGSLKAKLFTQSYDGGSPVTMTYYGNVVANSSKWPYNNVPYLASHRFSYTNQLLIARKMGDHLSLQFSPTFIHRNFVENNQADNNIWDLGFAARYLFKDNFSLSVDYHQMLSEYTADNYDNSLTFGFNFLTAGHAFQIFASNSVGMIEQHYIPETKGSWLDGNIHLGFTIVRNFTLKAPDYF